MKTVDRFVCLPAPNLRNLPVAEHSVLSSIAYFRAAGQGKQDVAFLYTAKYSDASQVNNTLALNQLLQIHQWMDAAQNYRGGDGRWEMGDWEMGD